MTTSPKKSKASAPHTFELTIDQMDKIEVCRKNLSLATASEVIRTAITCFDFSKCKPVHVQLRQISVRLSVEHRATLKRQARLKSVSVGELLRLALESLSAKEPRNGKAVRKLRRR